MRIAHTESSFGWGGQEIRILTESRKLLDRGIEVILFVDPRSTIAKRAAIYGIKTELFRLERKGIRELLSMIRAINEIRPDILSTHSSTDHWISAVARFFSSHKPLIVRTRHVSATVKPNLATKWLYKKGCEFVVTTGKSIRDDLLSRGIIDASRSASIPTGIDLQQYSSTGKMAARIQAFKRHGIDEKFFLFGNIATLRSWKGHHDLIIAFRKLYARVSDVCLLIVGDGPQRTSLKDLVISLEIEDRVFFAGHQQDTQVYFDALDAFIFPSYANEGVPQSILQAMAFGLPIVTTDIGSISEAVGDYDSVIFVKPRATEELAAAMETVYLRGGARSRLDAPLQQRISIETMAEKMAEVYNYLIRLKEVES